MANVHLADSGASPDGFTSGTEGSMQDHLSIFNPIRSRNPEAACEAMRKHLLRVQRIFFEP